MIAATQSNHPMGGATNQSERSPLDYARERLHESQMRVTKPRIAILKVLLQHEKPVSIEQIHQELARRSCDLVTVYRCLAAFEQIGLVRRSFLHNGTALYEFAQGGRPRHYHVICKSCGRAENIDYFSVEGMERMLKERGYAQLTHMVEFFGICPTCRQSVPARNAAPEVDPESWTPRIVNPNSGERSPCRRNVVSTVPSSKPRSDLMP